MKYLNHKQFRKEKHRQSRIFINKCLDKDIQEELIEITLKNLQNSTKRKKTEIINTSGLSVFSKTGSLRHRNNSIRATFGLKRRGWNVPEIYNQLKLSSYTYIPNVFCYGYKRNHFGLVSSTTLVSEYKNNTFNIIELIEKHPNLITPALETSFDIILKHLSHNFIHLDLWASNILVTEDLSKQWIIDVDFCKFNPKKSLEEKLGFCLGYFHRHAISQYIPYSEYKIIVDRWISNKSIEINKNETLSYCAFFTENKMNRKALFNYF
jgi:hypothetical protein